MVSSVLAGRGASCLSCRVDLEGRRSYAAAVQPVNGVTFSWENFKKHRCLQVLLPALCPQNVASY